MADVKDNDNIEELPPDELPPEEEQLEDAPPPIEGEEQEVNLDATDEPLDELPPEEAPPQAPAEEASDQEAPMEELPPEEPAPADALPPETAAEGEAVEPVKPASQVSKRGRLGRAAASAAATGGQPKKPSTLKKIVVFASPILLIGLIAGFFVAPLRDGKTPFKLLMEKFSGSGQTAGTVHRLEEQQKQAYEQVLVETNQLIDQVNGALPELEKARSLTDRDAIQKVRDQAEKHRTDVEGRLKQTQDCFNELTKRQVSDPDPKKFEEISNRVNDLHEKLKALVIDLDNKIVGGVKPPQPREGEETIIRSGPGEPKPKEQPAETKVENPFLKFKEGYWERRKTSQAGMVTFSDTWIVELKPDSVTIESEMFVSGSKMPGQRTTIEFKAGQARKAGNDKVDVGGTTYDCEIWESGNTRSWVIASGTYKGVGVKAETDGQVTMTVKELSQETINIKGKDFACIVVTRETNAGGTATKMRTWETKDAAHGPVKTEMTMNVGGQDVTSRTELIDFGDDHNARPDFPKPEETARPQEEPLPVPKKQLKATPPAAKKVENPFLKFKEGRWERRKMSQNTMTTLTDMWIVQLSEESVTTEGEMFTSGRKVPLPRTTTDFKGEARKAGDDKVDVGGTTYDCEIWESGNTRSWVIASGTYKGVAVKGEVDGKQVYKVIDLSEDSVTVKGTEFKCVVATQEMENPQGKTVSKDWRSADLAFGSVKSEIKMIMGGMEFTSAQELVDWGDDPKARPEFPAAKPEQPTDQPKGQPKADPMAERLAQADSDAKRGAELLKQIRQATSPIPPSDPGVRQNVAEKVRQAQELFGKVLETYEASSDSKYKARADKVRQVLESLANLAKKLE